MRDSFPRPRGGENWGRTSPIRKPLTARASRPLRSYTAIQRYKLYSLHRYTLYSYSTTLQDTSEFVLPPTTPPPRATACALSMPPHDAAWTAPCAIYVLPKLFRTV